MDLSPNQMLRLAPNKVDYLIPGGEMLSLIHISEPTRP